LRIALEEKSHGSNLSGNYLLTRLTSAWKSTLQNLIKLGAHTGARIEEICSLTLAKVASDRFQIEDAEPEAGWREIPIHKDIKKLVLALSSQSLDGFLLTGLSENKYGDRSNAIGKRFGRLKAKLGYGGDYVFHSFRKSIARQLEEAGVPENISARLVGHEIQTMTMASTLVVLTLMQRTKQSIRCLGDRLSLATIGGLL
jgi:integrase